MSDNCVSWIVDSTDPPPKELGGLDVITSTLIPRTVGWISVNDETVALLEGYTAAAYVPPTLYFAASALPEEYYNTLLQKQKCTVSAVTNRESISVLQQAAGRSTTKSNGMHHPSAFALAALHLTSAPKYDAPDYPCAIATSPIRMYCTLRNNVALGLNSHDAMIVLTVEKFVVDGTVIADPTINMKKDRDISGKIDAYRVNPRVGLGNGKDFPLLNEIRSMPRPIQIDNTTKSWSSNDFTTKVESTSRSREYENVVWEFRKHGRSCFLGFNPVTALVMPRPIGWISTFSKEGRVEHLAPYSFFTDVARGKEPMVAFSAYLKEGKIRKDAQMDAETMGCFCFNIVSEDLAVPMNYSAAELTRDESEFALSGLSSRMAELVDAPCVDKAHVVYECEYVKTVDVETFAIVIGSVKRISVNRNILSAKGGLDAQKLKPIMRMGYQDEYGVLH